jgi:hypothetical protein
MNVLAGHLVVRTRPIWTPSEVGNRLGVRQTQISVVRDSLGGCSATIVTI